MRNYHVGELIRKLRLQKGLSQSELAGEDHDPATISKIETGTRTPKKKTIYSLLEKLSYDPSGLDIFFLNDAESEEQKIINDLDSHLAYKRTSEATACVLKLESRKAFMKNRQNLQYILYAKALIRKNSKENIDGVLAALHEALEITKPNFTINDISEYLLTRQEMLIINNLAGLYMEKEQPDMALRMMYALKKNFDDYCIDKDYRGKYYPMIISNLSHFLSTAKRHEEVIKICDIGIKISRNTGYLHSLPYLFFNKATSLFELGNKAECEKLMRIAYIGYEMYGQPSLAEETKEYVSDKYGIIL